MVDVVVIGGGLAGLTLARQLRQRLGPASIVVLERQSFPVPEAAFKVGESTVEVGAHYLGEVVGLRDHLASQQLPKHGLRYFFPSDGNGDITRRVEAGPARDAAVPAWQIDRGRLENTVAALDRGDNIDVLDGSRVDAVHLDAAGHQVTYTRGARSHVCRARWVVDASGRGGVLKRQLDLALPTSHDVSASWFRIGRRLRIDDWGSSAEWRGFVPSGHRWLSTNHLMGRGYWVWLIPLASDSTSVGIVADASVHPLRTYDRFERALDWLHRHEPQCAEVVAADRDRLQDFRSLRHYSHACRRVFSAERWCLTGEAGVFTDPFYSPGSDFIAMSNDYITEIIARDLGGRDVAPMTEEFNRTYLLLFQGYLRIYLGQYPLMGNAQVMTAKLVWDLACYWGVTALIYFQRRYTDREFMRRMDPLLRRFFFLHTRVQAVLRRWDAATTPAFRTARVDVLRLPFLREWQKALPTVLPVHALTSRLESNVRHLEALAVALGRMAAVAGHELPGADAADVRKMSQLLDDTIRLPAAAGPARVAARH